MVKQITDICEKAFSVGQLEKVKVTEVPPCSLKHRRSSFAKWPHNCSPLALFFSNPLLTQLTVTFFIYFFDVHEYFVHVLVDFVLCVCVCVRVCVCVCVCVCVYVCVSGCVYVCMCV